MKQLNLEYKKPLSQQKQCLICFDNMKVLIVVVLLARLYTVRMGNPFPDCSVSGQIKRIFNINHHLFLEQHIDKQTIYWFLDTNTQSYFVVDWINSVICKLHFK